MATTTPDLDMSVVQSFAFKVLGDITAQQMGPLSAVADRLGLFQTLAALGSVTASELAADTGLQERYVLEWLSAMACHGYLAYDKLTEAFRLPPEHASVLADSESPLYLGSVIGMAEPYWRHVDELTEAFRDGGGIPQAAFGERFWCGFERFTGPAFRNFLCQDWIPAVPSVDAALRRGGSAADVGCGNGQALLTLARGYPDASLVGYDNYAPAIASATVHARAAALEDRVRFEVCDVVQGLPATYDLVTLFDVLHDMPHPTQALAAIAPRTPSRWRVSGTRVQPFRRSCSQPRASFKAWCVRLLRQLELLHDAGVGSRRRRHGHLHGRGAAARDCNSGRLRQSPAHRLPE